VQYTDGKRVGYVRGVGQEHFVKHEKKLTCQ
jgi:hypothetical protein